MSIKLCPKCHVVRNMVMSISTRVTSRPRGKLKQIRTKLFHCETCKSFVCSEDIEILEEAGVRNRFEKIGRQETANRGPI